MRAAYQFSVRIAFSAEWCLAKGPSRRGQLWVIRDRVERAASPAMSAMPLDTEVNSKH
jgi:hypothetical protein